MTAGCLKIEASAGTALLELTLRRVDQLSVSLVRLDIFPLLVRHFVAFACLVQFQRPIGLQYALCVLLDFIVRSTCQQYALLVARELSRRLMVLLSVTIVRPVHTQI